MFSKEHLSKQKKSFTPHNFKPQVRNSAWWIGKKEDKKPETRRLGVELNEFPLGTSSLLFNTIKSSLFHYRHQCENKQCDQDKGLEQHSVSLSLSSFSQRAITTSQWTGLKELNWLTENWWAELSRCTGKLWAARLGDGKSVKHLCPWPDWVIRGQASFAI